jgi:hypothetical protein
MNIHTTAKGTFSVYLPDSNNNYSLFYEGDNVITNQGLNNVAYADWAEQFTGLVAGTGSTTAAITDTALQSLVLSSFTYNAAPLDSYSLGSYNASTGATYQLVRSYALKNYTASPLNITELGTISGTSGTTNRNVFSRVVVPNAFTLSPGASAVVFYNLQLTIAATLTGSDTNNPLTFANGALPTPYVYGVGSCPITTVATNGGINPNAYFNLEPSNTRSLYTSNNTTLYTQWATIRSNFISNPLRENAALIGVSVSEVGTFTAEPYVNGTYTTRSAIVLSPGIVGSSYGYVVAAPGAGSVGECGFNIVWPTVFTGNATNFVKWYLRLTWGR